jgi:hypothetical protein
MMSASGDVAPAHGVIRYAMSAEMDSQGDQAGE